MTGKLILEAMSFIDDAYIEEASTETIRKRRPVRSLLPLAACLCLILLGLQLRPVPPAAPAEGLQQEPGMAMDVEVQQEQSANDIAVDPIMGANDIQIPGSQEVPSLVLCILEWTEDGFTASVDGLVDTDLIPAGTEINVRMTANMVVQTLRDGLVYAERITPTESDFPVGSLIRVMFCSYSAENNVLIIESICKEGQ